MNVSKQDKDQFKILINVYERRIYLLQQLAPVEYEASFDLEQESLKKLKQLLYQVNQMDDEKIEFILQLFILVSRSWEAFCLDSDGKQRFNQDKYSYGQEIFSLLCGFNFITSKQFIIQKFQNDKILNKVKENIKQNINTVEQIIGIQLAIENIDLYFQEQQFKEYFIHFYSLPFYTFSGYQGQTIYISRSIRNHNDYQMHIEWSIIEGLYYWSIKNKNPFLISSECLKTRLHPYKEIGDMYISKIYAIYINYVSPFRMNTSNQNSSFCSYKR